jgi:hypothetical protein
MTLGRGIAIAGIWIGVGIAAFGAGWVVILVALYALTATIVVSGN